jgi:hypothetical protein
MLDYAFAEKKEAGRDFCAPTLLWRGLSRELIKTRILRIPLDSGTLQCIKYARLHDSTAIAEKLLNPRI